MLVLKLAGFTVCEVPAAFPHHINSLYIQCHMHVKGKLKTSFGKFVSVSLLRFPF